MTTTTQGINSQEELKNKVKYQISKHTGVGNAINSYATLKEINILGDEIMKLVEAAIEAEASRRERAAEERVLDELDMLGRDEHELRDWIEAKRQSLKEKEAK